MTNNRKIFRVTIPTEDVSAFVQECQRSEWYAFDTGERIMTEEGPDGEAVVLVEPSALLERAPRAAMVH